MKVYLVEVEMGEKKRLLPRTLKLGKNVHWRLFRPAWTSDYSSGGLDAFNHLHDRGDVSENYFENR